MRPTCWGRGRRPHQRRPRARGACSVRPARRSPPRSSLSFRRARSSYSESRSGKRRLGRAGASGVTIVSGSSAALAHAAAESFLGRTVDPAPLEHVHVPGRLEIVSRGAARALGRRAQPGRRRLPPCACAARGLGAGRLDPRGQGRGQNAGGARRPSAGGSSPPARRARARFPRRSSPCSRREFFEDVEVVPEPAAALARAREIAGEEGAVLVTGSLYLLMDLASVRPSCLPWQASANG